MHSPGNRQWGAEGLGGGGRLEGVNGGREEGAYVILYLKIIFIDIVVEIPRQNCIYPPVHLGRLFWRLQQLGEGAWDPAGSPRLRPSHYLFICLVSVIPVPGSTQEEKTIEMT